MIATSRPNEKERTMTIYDQFPFGMKVSLDNNRIGEVVSYRPNNMIGVRILSGGSGETAIAAEYLVPLDGGRPSALRNFRAVMHCPAHFWQGMSGQPFTYPNNWLNGMAEVAYQVGIQAQP